MYRHLEKTPKNVEKRPGNDTTRTRGAGADRSGCI